MKSPGRSGLTGVVLSGGGARAAYQAGVLSYIAERCPGFCFPILTGVSAGAINASFLAAHRGSLYDAARELGEAWSRLTVDRVFRADVYSLTASAARWIAALGSAGAPIVSRVRGLVDTSPLRQFLHETLDPSGIQANIAAGRLHALALSATSYTTGETITFVQGETAIPMWERAMRRGVATKITVDHVMASAAIPLFFPAVEVRGDYYGDGAVRQSAPLAPAVHLGANRILAIAVRYARTGGEERPRAPRGHPPPAQVIGLLFHSVFLDSLDADAERLERINRLLWTLPTGTPNRDGLRPIELFVIRPSQDVGALAGEFYGRLPRAVRILLRGLGAHRTRNAELLSYLMFVEPFVSRLIRLGYDDAAAQWPALARFLGVS